MSPSSKILAKVVAHVFLAGAVLFLAGCSEDETGSDEATSSDPSVASSQTSEGHTPLKSSSPASLDAQPSLGVNFTHYGPNIEGYSILQRYHLKEVWQTVQEQLVAMRGNGAQTLRLLIWHFDEPSQDWGVINHRLDDGTIGLQPLYRTNLINYLTDVKNAGFARVTIAFGPSWNNSPLTNYEDCPGNFFNGSNQSDYFDQNWQFIQVVRAVAIEYGPVDLRFDLFNEGVPNKWLDQHCSDGKSTRAQMVTYGSRMLANYVNAYGREDVTISLIGSDHVVCNESGFSTGVLDTMIDDYLEMFGDHTPAWIALHLYASSHSTCDASGKMAAILAALRAADAKLNGLGLTKLPIVIQETYHDNAQVAEKVALFQEQSQRVIEELLVWPHTPGSSEHIDVSPPYSLENYLPLQE